jgi:hypothetical protein
MRDFTLTAYRSLLDSLQETGMLFQPFEEFLRNPFPNAVILRHDVDDRKLHSLEFARIQHERSIRGTYFFRMVPQSFDVNLIREIYEMGHEIGYHYEDMDFARGDPRQAIQFFGKHLEKLRKIAPVTTICMHGSPRSKYDNKDVWKHYNYRDYGICGEPYFDLDFKKVFYLTDTGRRWDGHKVSIRDKVPDYFGVTFHSTNEIIHHLKSDSFPKQVMFTFHPQRWTDNRSLWLKAKYFQALKNWVKYHLIKLR